MKFLELHFDRFGCFTDRRLTFRPDAPLTVIYGANEAGKSTALTAIADVLYGIEARSPFDFMHRYQDMRLGAAIVGDDGRRFDFRRRKGSQNTLLDARETPLADDALFGFLGGVDRALFLDAFGLDRERLRAGAKRLIDGSGKVGESLLAAAPGLSSLIALRASLAAEADSLYPTGRKVASRRFWQACERHANARKRVRQESLQAETVRAARAAREDATRAVDRLKEEQRKLRQELSRLGRLKATLPRLRRIDDLEAERAGLGTLPAVDGDFPARCRTALEARRTLASDIQRLDGEIAEARANLEGLSVDDALLNEADAVDRLADQRAAVVKAAEDLPKREAELAALRQQGDEYARRLGLTDRDVLLARRPPDAAVARARGLLQQRRRLRDQREERRQALNDIATELDNLARRRQALGHVADPAPLRRQLDGFAGLPDRMAGREELALTLAARQADLEDRVRRLTVPVASADDLARLPVPDAASVEQAIERFDALAKRRDDLVSERHRLESRKTRIERQLGELGADGVVPTADALGEARADRQALWQDLRPRLLGEAVPPDPMTKVVAYEVAVARADQLADRRQAEADRIASFRKLKCEQGEIAQELAALERAAAELEADAKASEDEWTRLWSPAGLTPKAPREMRGWLHSAVEIVRLRGELSGERARLGDIDAKLAETTGRFHNLAHSLGLQQQSGNAAELLKDTSAAVGEMEKTFQDARLIAKERDGCERRQRELEAALGELDRQDLDWRTQWSQAAQALGLREETLDEEAEAALSTWQAVPALEASLRDLEHRVERIHQDREAFQDTARALCRAVAPDLVAAPPLSASATLRERLVEARQAAARRDSHASTLIALQNRAEERRRQEQLNAGELEELCRAAGVDDWASLGALAGKVERDLELAGQLAKERKALLDAADGLSEAELRTDLAEFDPDSLSARLQELDDAQEVLEGQLGEAIRKETRAEGELQDIEARSGAAAAAQDEQNALAEIADIIETWTAVVAAERLLSAAIEAYRAQHQNPLLERASQAFAIATDGAFSGISLDYGDSDDQRIVAVRKNGSHLAVDALSEGTADQLFLALRIATVEDHARRARPLPFIADDLFVTFDDLRTKAGLRLLADLGRTTQAIIFTHHQHVVEAARHTLGGQVDVIDLA